MDKETLIEILKSKSMSFTNEEIKKLMDEELSKDPSEMDTALVDLCLDALDGKLGTIEKSVHKTNIGKFLVTAAIIITALCIAVPVGAKVLNIDASSELVKFAGDHFDVDLRKKGIDVAKELKKKGFENLVIPDEIMKDDYLKSDLDISEDENEKSIIYFDFKNKSTGVAGSITIDEYTNSFDLIIGQAKVSDEFESVKQITESHIDVLVFGNEEEAYIIYIDKDIEYNIALECDFKTAKEIAKTIK